MNNQKRTISCHDAAQMLGTSHQIIKAMIKKGIIQGTVIETTTGRDRIIIPRAKFEEYLGEKLS